MNLFDSIYGVRMNEDQRKAIFAALEQKKKEKQMQIKKTKKLGEMIE